jgi:hypothetical protein
MGSRAGLDVVVKRKISSLWTRTPDHQTIDQRYTTELSQLLKFS